MLEARSQDSCLLEYVQPSQEEYHSVKLGELKYPTSPKEKTILKSTKSEIFIKMNSNKIFWGIIKYQSWAQALFDSSERKLKTSPLCWTPWVEGRAWHLPRLAVDVGKNITVKGRALLFWWSPVSTPVLAEYSTGTLLGCLLLSQLGLRPPLLKHLSPSFPPLHFQAQGQGWLS